MSAAPDPGAGGGPGRRHWLLAGQQLLREHGLPGVKLGALCEVTGLTTGSFYHHFAGMAAYLEALASFYGADQVRSMLGRIEHEAPLERLRKLARMAQDEDMAPLDAAMRDWAGSDRLAAEAVAAADAALLGFLVDAFVELGHDRDEARLRALVLLSAGVARVDAPWRIPHAAERVVGLLVQHG